MKQETSIKILFDFELFGDPNMDAQLLDVMLTVKQKLGVLLEKYEERIVADAGLILVTLGPKKLSLRYHYDQDKQTHWGVMRLLNQFDWQEIICSHAKVVLN